MWCSQKRKKQNTHQATLQARLSGKHTRGVGMELQRGPPLRLPRRVWALRGGGLLSALEFCTHSASERVRHAAGAVPTTLLHCVFPQHPPSTKRNSESRHSANPPSLSLTHQQGCPLPAPPRGKASCALLPSLQSETEHRTTVPVLSDTGKHLLHAPSWDGLTHLVPGFSPHLFPPRGRSCNSTLSPLPLLSWPHLNQKRHVTDPSSGRAHVLLTTLISSPKNVLRGCSASVCYVH